MSKFDHTKVFYPSQASEEQFYDHNGQILARLEGGEKFAILIPDPFNQSDVLYLEKEGGNPSLYYALIVLGDRQTLPYPIFEMAYDKSFKSRERAKYWRYKSGHTALLNLISQETEDDDEANIRAIEIEALLGVKPISPVSLTASSLEFRDWMSGQFGNQFSGVMTEGMLHPSLTKRERIAELADLVRNASKVAELMNSKE